MVKARYYFVYYFWFTGWGQISLGINISLAPPNVELHIPFGFFKVGFEYTKIKDERFYALKWRPKGHCPRPY